MIEEMQSLDRNYTWDLVDKPTDQKVVKSKWVYKIKAGTNVEDKLRYKARLVAKGFT